MATAESSTEPVATGLLGRLLYALRHPTRTTLIAGGLVCLALAGTLSLTMFGSDGEPVDAYPKAWELFKEARYSESRAMATRLLMSREPKDSIGEGAYLIGRNLCGEAENEWNKTRRVGMYLIASRYLHEAYHEGFPDGHEDEGLYYLARSTFESDRPTASLPYWVELSRKEPTPFRKSTLDYLKRVYLLDWQLDEAEGLGVIDRIEEDPELTRDEREQLILDRADLMLRSQQFEEGLAVLDQLPADSSVRPSQRLLKVRILLASAQAAEDGARRGERISQSVETMYEEAVSELLGLEVSLLEDPADGDLAMYHLAQCYLRLGDLDHAEQLFGQVRRGHLDDSLGWAAGVEEAYSHFMQADLDEATVRFHSVLESMKRARSIDDRWLSLGQMLQKYDEFLVELVDEKRYGDALLLAKALWPPLPRESSLSWQAQIHLAWGDDLMAIAKQVEPPEDVDTAAARDNALSHHREAGVAYLKLARLEHATTRYAEYLLAAADSFYDGHDYSQARDVYRKVLDEEPGDRSAWLFLRIGECQRALGKLDAAMRSFDDCVNQFPDDPDSYLARLAMSEIYLDREDPGAAKQLLIRNLETTSLTPDSREWRLSLLALARTLYREALLLEAESRTLGLDDPAADPEPGLRKLEESYEAFTEAIRRLNEVARRYGDDPDILEYRYLLAEAHRAAANWPRKKALQVTVASSRQRLEEQARNHSREAASVIAQLLQDLSRRQDLRQLDEVEKHLLRNCFFAHADLLFDLEKFPEAIEAYSSAANRYNDRPESLEAFVRIATCHRQLGNFDDARGVVEQAKLFLSDRIPADADFTGTTRHSRDEWSRFLDLLSQL